MPIRPGRGLNGWRPNARRSRNDLAADIGGACVAVAGGSDARRGSRVPAAVARGWGCEAGRAPPVSNKRIFRLVHAQARAGAELAIRLAPDGYMVVISEPTRTLDQNAKFHAV